MDGKHYAQENGMAFLETSAKDDINVSDAFKSLGKLAVHRQNALNPNKND